MGKHKSTLIWNINYNNIQTAFKGSLLVLDKLFVVLVVPWIILLEPLKMFLCIKRVILLVCKDQATFCSNGSFSHLNHTNQRVSDIYNNPLSLSVLSHFQMKRWNQMEPHFDPHLSDLEVTLVLCRQDHTGFLPAAFCEKTFRATKTFS